MDICGSRRQRFNVALRGGAGEFDFAGLLEVEPEAFAGAEETAQAQGGVGGNGAAALDDLAEPRRRNPGTAAEPVAGQAVGLHPVFEEDLAGGDCGMGRRFHGDQIGSGDWAGGGQAMGMRRAHGLNRLQAGSYTADVAPR